MTYIPAAKRRTMPHAGPGDSYPLDAAHLRAAWDLAGRTKRGDPDSIRRKVIAFAKAHGLLGRLPATAIAWGRAHGLLGAADVRKAKQSRIAALLQLAWNHESMENDVAEKHRLVSFAREHGLTGSLPESAHGFMHEAGIEHDHGDGKLRHSHLIEKARTDAEVVEKFSRIEKAWALDDGTTVIEGWVSTEDRDQDKDVVPPEAFKGALAGYAARRMPLSSNHDMKGYPIGHMQRVALVRDGRPFAEARHPDDGAGVEFEHFPGTGTGVYGRGVVTDPRAGDAVKKGNLGGFSWVGTLTKYEVLPDGGRKFHEVEPWMETTIAAYPVNAKAVVVAAKAHTEQGETDDMGKLEDILLGAAEALDGEPEPAPEDAAVTKAELTALLERFKADFGRDLLAEVRKALGAGEPEPVPVPVREEGAGRQGTVEKGRVPGDGADFEADPAVFVVAKARRGDELTEQEREVAWAMTRSVLANGMASDK